LLLISSLMTVRAAENAHADATVNPVQINTAFINKILGEARTNNPALLAADSKVRAAALNAAAVRTWDDPMGMVGGSIYSEQGFKPSEDGNLAYGIEQKLPLWSRPKLTHRVAEAEILVRKADVNFRVQQLRSDITKALLTTALAERIVEIGEQDLSWLQATSQAADSSYRTGQGSVADTLLIQNEVAKRKDNLRTERLRLAHEHFTLNRLLNRPVNSSWPLFELPPVGPIIPLSKRLFSLAEKNEPKLKVLDQEIKQAEATAELTHTMRLPDVSLGAEGRQYSGDGGFRSGMFSLRFSLPWTNRDKYRKDYDRDKEKIKTAELERADQILMLQEELHHLAIGIDASAREALLQSNELILRSTQALSSRLTEWQSGKAAFRDVLDTRRTVLESLLMSARAISEQHQMLAEMLLWTGLNSLEELSVLATESPLFPEHEGHSTGQ
jgi:cobalt-zinc-cadmium efflux system outer membrane protein